MKVVELIRLENTEHGMLGVLRINKHVFCVTLEPPEAGNVRNLSCIPAGQYRLESRLSPRFGETYEVVNVPGRSHILFHAGNTVEHTEGCILLGSSPGKLLGKRAVLNSGATFKTFMETLGVQGKPAVLSISEVF